MTTVTTGKRSHVVGTGSSRKLCPYCRSDINPGAEKCGHCGEWVTQGKKHWAYLVLGILLGPFGAHNFYAGRNIRGLIKAGSFVVAMLMSGIAASLDPFLFVFPSLIVGGLWVWVIAELLTTSVDASGSRFH